MLWLCVAALFTGPAQAQPAAPDAAATPPTVSFPSFWDPKRRPERPELPPTTVIRFLTEVDYPPFNFAAPDGNPSGFNVDLSRLICEELKLGCTVQMRRFDTLVPALTENRGDAVIASLAKTTEVRRRVDFTDPYYRSPARFIALKTAGEVNVLPEGLAGVPVGVVAGTAHEAYLKLLFAGADIRAFPNDEAARNALKAGDVKVLFGDAIQLSFWLNGADSAACCGFVGGPFTESRFFGEGVGIAVRRGNDPLRQALNWALSRLWETGRFTDLWLRYFPVSPF